MCFSQSLLLQLFFRCFCWKFTSLALFPRKISLLQKRYIFYLLKEAPLILKEAFLRFFKGFKEFPFRTYYKLRSPDYKIINFENTQKSDVETASKNLEKSFFNSQNFLTLSLIFTWIGHLIREQGTDKFIEWKKLRNIFNVLNFYARLTYRYLQDLS